LGLALWWPPYRAVAPLARLGRPDAETFATAVLLAAFVLFPAWALALAAAAWLAWGGFAAAATLVLAPTCGVVGLAWWERRAQVQDDVVVFLRLSTRDSLRRRLCRQRDALAGRIEAMHAALEPAPGSAGAEG
jgi:hypothetical protein